MQEARQEARTQHANAVLRDSFDLATTQGIPESLKEQEAEVLGQGIIDACQNPDLTPEQKVAFATWAVELYATSIPRQMPENFPGGGGTTGV